jgi:indoleamine 2,3-dioxygenase
LAVISTSGLGDSPVFLRRAHLVLAFNLHFYVQSLPPTEEVSIPRSISIPILQVAKELDIPPVLTFSDTVLYNWDFRTSPKSEDEIPTASNIHTQTMFTRLVDEEEFYLCSARIEMRGVEILELMRVTMDETFVGDVIAVRRIKDYLHTIAGIIADLKDLLLSVKNLCNPDIYYNQVRPWLRGEDASENKRKWVFEGADEEDFQLSIPMELSGPSAGQSALIHALDIFLGVDHRTTSSHPSFMSRMQLYMPRNHRLFLDHIKANPRPLRAFVMGGHDAGLLEAYNNAVLALKEFRDAHMIIAALYILGPARRAKAAALGRDVIINNAMESDGVKGTGGTDLVKFLKDIRNRTGNTVIP